MAKSIGIGHFFSIYWTSLAWPNVILIGTARFFSIGRMVKFKMAEFGVFFISPMLHFQACLSVLDSP